MTNMLEQELRVALIEQKLIKKYIYDEVFFLICCERGTILTDEASIDDLSEEQISEIFQERVIDKLTKLDVAKARENFIVYSDQTFKPHRRFYGVTPVKLMITDLKNIDKVIGGIIPDFGSTSSYNDFESNIQTVLLPYIKNSNASEISESETFLLDYLKYQDNSKSENWTIDNCIFEGMYVRYPGNKGYDDYVEHLKFNRELLESIDNFDLLVIDPD